MTITSDKLRELHRIHLQLCDLRERLDRGPRQVEARRRGIAALEAKLAEEQKTYQQVRMAADNKQLDLKTSESKVLDLKTKLNTCSTNKEYQSLLDQIAATEMADSVLSDEILEALEQIDELAGQVGDAEKKIATAGEELEKLVGKVADESDSIREDITRLEADLKSAESALQGDIRVNYDRIVRAKGGDAMAPMAGGYCSGCSQQLTTNIQANLTMGKPIFCPTCGRLLYMPEDQ